MQTLLPSSPAPRTMTQVLERVQERTAALQPVDVIDRLPKYEFKFPAPDDADKAIGRLIELDGGHSRNFELTDRSLNQLLDRLGIPARYFLKCPRQLQWAQANWWVQNGAYDKAMMLRLVQGNRVRAAMSESYTAFDDQDVLPMVADVIGDLGGEVVASDFADEFTHLRIVFPREHALQVGDVVQAGFHFTNSEVGCRAIHIHPFIHRLKCTNGMVGSAEFSGKTSIRHVGNVARIKDYVANALDDARNGTERMIEKFRDSLQHAIEDPEKLLAPLAETGGPLTQQQLQNALASFGRENDRTLFGAVNAITDAAKSEPTWERRYQMERVGSSLLARA